MNGRRVVAAVVAVGLVVGAIVVRRSIDDGSTGGSTGGGSPSLLCTPETEAACRALGGRITVEDPGVTADRLAGATAELGADLWVAPKVWIDLVAERRRQASLGDGPLAAATPVLANTPLDLVIKDTSVTTATAACNGVIDWACIAGPGTRAGIRVGVDPTSTTPGLLTRVALTAALLGTTAYATNDFDDPRFTDGVAALNGSLVVGGQGGTTALERLLNIPASSDAATAVGAVATPSVAGAAASSTLKVLTPAPRVSAQAIAAGSRTAVSSLDVGELRGALTGHGWTAGAAPGSPANSGLPNAGVMVGLISRWNG